MTTVRLKWLDGLQFVGESESGHAIVIDGSTEGGGTDKAVRPMELLLMSLACCAGMDTVSILKKKNQPPAKFEVQVRAERSEDHPKKFTRIELEFIATGAVEPAALARAISLSMDKYCSVKATLEGKPEILVQQRILPG